MRVFSLQLLSRFFLFIFVSLAQYSHHYHIHTHTLFSHILDFLVLFLPSLTGVYTVDGYLDVLFSCGSGVSLIVMNNGVVIRGFNMTYGHTVFHMSVGTMLTGDAVRVAVGPGANALCDAFGLDFEVRGFVLSSSFALSEAMSSIAFSNTATNMLRNDMTLALSNINANIRSLTLAVAAVNSTATAALGSTPNRPGASCTAIKNNVPGAVDGLYYLQPTPTSAVSQVYCDMTSDVVAWALVGVALQPFHAQAGWESEGELNPSLFGQLNSHWHFSQATISALSQSQEFKATCFNSRNNYIRYWWSVSMYRFTALSDQTTGCISYDNYAKTGTCYEVRWAGGHYGLVSGNNEIVTLITSHSGNEWACGGSQGPNGEGFTGRGGISNIRLWTR